MRRTIGTAWIANTALSAIVAEAEGSYPAETGGLLLGYWSAPYTEVVITDIIDPGPQSIHEPTRFVPDADYQENELARRFCLDPARLGYLGDWHSHPRGTGMLSRQDRKTLTDIATCVEARAPVPLMAVVALSPGVSTDWKTFIWRFGPKTPRWPGRDRRITLLRLQPFS